jgi:hypothetical protein
MSGIKRLGALVEAWDFATYPGPFHVEPRYRHDEWWADNKMGDSIQITPKDVDLMLNALPALLDVAEAARRFVEFSPVEQDPADAVWIAETLHEALGAALARLDS